LRKIKNITFLYALFFGVIMLLITAAGSWASSASWPGYHNWWVCDSYAWTSCGYCTGYDGMGNCTGYYSYPCQYCSAGHYDYHDYYSAYASLYCSAPLTNGYITNSGYSSYTISYSSGGCGHASPYSLYVNNPNGAISNGGSNTHTGTCYINGSQYSDSITIKADWNPISSVSQSTVKTGSGPTWYQSVRVTVQTNDSGAAPLNIYTNWGNYTSNSPTYVFDYNTSSTTAQYLNFNVVNDDAGHTYTGTLPTNVGPFYIDSIAPSIPGSFSCTSHTLNTWYTNNATPISFSWTAATDSGGSGLKEYRWRLVGTNTTYSGTTTGTSASQASPIDGKYTLYVKTVDNAGNESSEASLSQVWIDASTAAPAIVSSRGTVSNVWTNLTGHQITITAPSNISGMAGISYTTDGSEPDTIIDQAASSYTLPSTYSTQGTYTFKAKVKSISGVWSQTRTFILNIDISNPPDIMITAPNTSTWMKSVNAYWNMSNDMGGSNISTYRYRFDRASATVLNSTDSGVGNVTSYTFLPSPLVTAQDYYLHIRPEDSASNLSYNTAHRGPFWVDVTNPSNITGLIRTAGVQANGIWTANNMLSMQWNASNDNVTYATQSGVAGYSYAANASAGTLADGTYDTVGTQLNNIVLPNSATAYFHVHAVDNVGNVGVEANLGPFKIDAAIPAGPVLSCVHSGGASMPDGVNGWTNKSGVFTFSINAPFSVSGIDRYSYTTDGTTPGDTNGIIIVDPAGSDPLQTFQITKTEGTYSINVRAKNNAGTWGNVTSFLLKIDTTIPPDISITAPATGTWLPNIGAYWTTSYDQGGSGINTYRYKLDNVSGTLVTSSDNGFGNVTYYTFPASALVSAQNYWLHIRPEDQAINISASTAHRGPFWVDVTPPTDVANVRCTSGHTTGTWSNNPVVRIDWNQASDAHSGLDGYVYSWDTNSNTEPAPGVAAANIYYQASLIDGNNLWFHVRSKDKVANYSTNSTHIGPFLIDTTGPVGSITIADDTDGSSIYQPENGYFDQTTVGFSWSISDSGSGINSVAYQLDSAAPVWGQSANGSLTCSLSEGVHTVYVIARDSVGNSSTFSKNIIVDLTAPVLNMAIAPDSDSNSDGISPIFPYYDDNTVDFSWEMSDASGPYQSGGAYRYRVATSDIPANTEWNAWSGFAYNGNAVNFVAYSNDGSYQNLGYVQARDRAGHVTESQAGFYVDMVAPVILGPDLLLPVNFLPCPPVLIGDVTPDIGYYGKETVVVYTIPTSAMQDVGGFTSSPYFAKNSIGTVSWTPYNTNTMNVYTSANIYKPATFNVAVADKAGNIKASAVGSQWVDTTTPNFYFVEVREDSDSGGDGVDPEPNWYDDSSITLKWDPAWDSVSLNTKTYFFSTNNGLTWSSGISLNTIGDINVGAVQGIVSIQIKVADAAGHVATKDVTVNVDTVSPTGFAVNWPQSGYYDKNNVVVSWTPAADNCQLKDRPFRAKVDNNAWSEWFTGQQFQFTGLAEGMRTLYLEVADRAGNVSISSTTLYIMASAPDGTLELSPKIISRGTWVHVTLNMSIEDISLLPNFQSIPELKMVYRYEDNSSSTPIVLSGSGLNYGLGNYTGEYIYKGDFLFNPGITPNSIEFYLSATNNAGTATKEKLIQSLIFSQGIIGTPTLILSDQDTYSTVWTNDLVVSVTLQGGGAASYWLLTEVNTPPVSPQDSRWSNSNQPLYTFKNNTNGLKTIYSWIMDAMGNISAGTSAAINYDATLPYVVSIDITNMPNISAGTKTVTINLSEELTYLPYAVIPEMWVTFNGGVKTNLNLTKVSPSLYTATLTIDGATPEGAAVFGVRIIDNANNVGSQILSGGSIVIDKSNPVVTSFKVMDRLTGSTLYTNSNRVDLEIKSSDSGSGIGWWLVTENNTFTPQANDSNWSGIVPEVYTLSGDQGAKKLYIWVKDLAQNISARATANNNLAGGPIDVATSIVYDSMYTPPTVDIQLLSIGDIHNVYSSTPVTVTLRMDNETQISTASLWIKLYGQDKVEVPLSSIINSGGNSYSCSGIVPFTVIGTANFEVSVTDVVGNATTRVNKIYYNTGISSINGGEIRINRNVAVPTVTMFDRGTSSSQYTNNQMIGVNIGNDPDAVRWLLSESSTGVAPEANDQNWRIDRPITYTFKNRVNELKSLFVWVKNRNEIISPVSTVATINYDDVIPFAVSVDIDNSPYVNGGVKTITVNLSEALQETPLLSLTVNGISVVLGPAAKVSGTKYTWVFNSSGMNGLGTFGIKITDNASNVGTGILAGGQISIDSTSPNISTFRLFDKLTGSELYTNARVVDLTLSGSSDINSWIITENSAFVPDTADSNWGAKPTSYQLTNVQGTHNVYIWGKDYALNINSNTTTIVYDNLIPEIGIDINHNPLNPITATKNLNVTINVLNIPSGISVTPNLYFNPYQKAAVPVTILGRTGTQFYGSITINSQTANGPAYFSVQVTDNARNYGTSVQWLKYSSIYFSNQLTVNIALITPTFILYDLDSKSSQFTNDFVVGVSYNYDQRSSAWLISETQSTNPSLTDPLWQSTPPVYFVLKNTNNGTRTSYLWTKDAAGNINTVPAIAIINYDNVFPQATSINFERGRYIKAGTSRVTVNISESVSATPDFYLTFMGSKRTITFDYFDGLTLAGFFTVDPNENGTAVINLTITDNALNITNVIPAGLISTINFDTVLPPDPTLGVNTSGLNRPDNSSGYTNTPTINVTISKDPDYFRYVIRELTAVPSENAEDWMPEPVQYRFVYETQGTRNLYLWVKDRAGNISNQYAFNSIVYDIDIPTGSLKLKCQANRSNQITNSLSNIVELAANDTDYYIITENAQFGKPDPLAAVWSAVKPANYDFDPDNIEEGPRYLYCWLMDKSGNINNVVVTTSIYYDPSVPNIGLLLTKSGWISTGDVSVTLDIGENIIVTPDLTYEVGGTTYSVELTPVDITRNAFIATLNVTEAFPNGFLTFHMTITDNAGTVTSDTFSYGTTTLNVDTVIPIIATAAIYDMDKPNSYNLTNDNPFNITMAITESTIKGYYISSNLIADPASIPPGTWLSERPQTYFHSESQGQYGYYIWVKDHAGNISLPRYVSTNFDAIAPTVSVEMARPPGVATFYGIGVVAVTINFNEPIASDSLSINIVCVADNRVNTLTYTVVNSQLVTGSFSVDGSFGDGRQFFRIIAEDLVGNRRVSDKPQGNYLENLDWPNTFVVATGIGFVSLKILDRDNLNNFSSSKYTNERYINMLFDQVALVTHYMITSNIGIKPVLVDITSPNNSESNEFSLNNYYISPSLAPDNQETVVTYNLWVKGASDIHNESTINASILVDLLTPEVTVSLNEGIKKIHAGEYILTVSVTEYIPSNNIKNSKFTYFNAATKILSFTPVGSPDSNNFYNTFRTTINIDSDTPSGQMTLSFNTYDKAGNRVDISTTYDISVVPNPSFNITDTNNGSPVFTNELTVSLNIISDDFADFYIITENATYYTRPERSFTAWRPKAEYTDSYTLSSGDGPKTLAFWVKDSSDPFEANINTKLITRTITLDTMEPTVNIRIGKTLGIGYSTVTFNYNEPILVAPSYFITMTPASGSPNALTRSIDILYSVSSNHTWIGQVEIRPFDVNDTATISGQTIDRAGNLSTSLFGTVTFSIDTLIPDPTFNIIDTDTDSNLYVNDLVVGLQIGNDKDAVKYMVSYTQSTQPTLNSPGWNADKPSNFTLKNVVNENKKLYLWVQDAYKNINKNVVSANIFYDDTPPQTEVKFGYRPYIKEGDYKITLNITQEILALNNTPDFKVQYAGQEALAIDIVPMDSSRYLWVGTINVNAEAPEGVATFSLSVTDNASNVQNKIISGMQTFVIDKTRPAAPGFTAYDPITLIQSYTNQRTIGVSVNIDSSVYMWYLSDQTNVTPDFDAVGWLTQQPTTFTFSDMVISTKNIKLWIQDRAGNISSTGSRSIYLDYDEPTATILISTYPNVKAGILNITLNVSEATLVGVSLNYTLYGYGQVARNVTLNQVSALTYTGTINVTEDFANGAALFNVQLVDYSGNRSNKLSGDIVFQVDTLLPEFSVHSIPDCYLNNTTLNITLNVSEAVSATPSVIFHSDIDAPVIMSCIGLNVWTGSLYISDSLGFDSSASLDVTVTDNAGNRSLAFVKPYTIDKIPADFTVESIKNSPNLAIGSYTLTLNVSEHTINPPQAYFSMSDSSTHSILMSRSINNYWAGDIIISDGYPEGICTINIRVTDYAGNVTSIFGGIVTFNVLITLADPTMNITDRTSGDKIYTNEYSIAVDVGNDNTAVKWMVNETQSVKPEWNAAGWQSSKPNLYTLNAGPEGHRKVYLWIQDSARNINKTIVSQNIILDTIKPVSQINMTKRDFVSIGAVSLTLSIQEDTPATPELKLVYADGSTLNFLLKGVSPNIYTATFNIFQNDPQGVASFYLCVTDNASNVQNTLVGDKQFVLDTVASTPSFVIFDYDTGDTNYTHDLLPRVIINSDADVVSWILSEVQPTRPSPTSNYWRNEKPYEYTFRNTDFGIKTVYLWVKDSAGNINDMSVTRSISYFRSTSVNIEVTAIKIFNQTGSTYSYIRTGDTLLVTAGIYHVDAIATSGIHADLSNFGKGRDVMPDRWNNEIAQWDISSINVFGSLVTLSIYAVSVAGSTSNTAIGYAIVSSNPVLTLYDPDSLCTHYTNDYVVDINIENDTNSVAWIISEQVSGKPAVNDFRWRTYRPVAYIFKNFNEGNKTVYLWTKDSLNNINPGIVSWNVIYDITFPKTSISRSISLNATFGVVSITLNISESVVTKPILSFVPSGDVPIDIDLQIGTSNVVWTATFNILATMNNKDAYFYVSATDNAGNNTSGIIGRGLISSGGSGSGSGDGGGGGAGEGEGDGGGGGTGEGEGEGGGGTQVGSGKVLVINDVTDLSSETVEIGSKDVALLKLDLRSSGNVYGWAGIDIVLTGNIIYSDISAVKIYRATTTNSLERALLISEGTNMFDPNTLVAKIVFPYSAVENINASGNSYIVAVDISKTASPRLKFSIVIPSSSSFICASENTVEYGHFPIGTMQITMKAATKKCILAPSEYVVPYASQGGKDVVAGSFELKADKDFVLLESICLTITGNITNSDLSGIKLYKDDGDNIFNPSVDVLISNGDFDMISRNVLLTFNTLQKISLELIKYYVAIDFPKGASVGRHFGIIIPNKNALSVNDENEILNQNFPYISDINTLNRYVSSVAVLPEQIITGSLYQGTSGKPLCLVHLCTDYEQATVNSISFSIEGTNNAQDEMLIQVYNDANANNRFDGPDILLGQTGVSSASIITINFDEEFVLIPSTKNLIVNISVGNTSVIGHSFGISIKANNLFTGKDLSITPANLNYTSDICPIIDKRQPSKPEVSGNYFVINPSTFVRNIYSSVPEGKITKILNAIGSAPGLADIMPWVEVTQGLHVASTKSNRLRNLPDSQTMDDNVTIIGLNLEHNKKYYYSVKAVNNEGLSSFESETTVIPFAVDLTPPVAPADKHLSVIATVVSTSTANIYTHVLNWNAYSDLESGIKQYELWQCTGIAPAWTKAAEVTNNKTTITLTDREAETAYYYKIRAMNSADNFSNFDIISDQQITSVPGALITKLSNYPNPFDSRQGITTITYFLNKDVGMSIKIYDPFGQKVWERGFASGTNGGQKGANTIVWDGRNDNGRKVGKGGYIGVFVPEGLQPSPLRRMIGVIH